MLRQSVYILSFVLSPLFLHAQSTDSTTIISLEGYLDAGYGAYPIGSGADFQAFSTVFPRDNQLALNVAQLGVHYDSENIRANVVLHYGDIMQATWDNTYSAVQQANVGFHLGKGWWINTGFFATHIGTESFLPKNNYTISTAVATYNEPFYQGGANLSWEGSDRFYMELWVLNGYNLFIDNNKAKSVGGLFCFAFSENCALTYTNLFGYEQPSTVGYKTFRSYHNLYLNETKGRFDFQIGADFGQENYSNDADTITDAQLFNALVTVRYNITSKFSTTAKAEYFNDPEGFISGIFPKANGTTGGLNWRAITLGFEYNPVENSYFRIEGRYAETPDDLQVFGTAANPSANRLELLASLGFYFEELIKTF